MGHHLDIDLDLLTTMLYIAICDVNIFLYFFTVFSYFLCEGCFIQLGLFSITDGCSMAQHGRSQK